jgi:hypothetical protein
MNYYREKKIEEFVLGFSIFSRNMNAQHWLQRTLIELGQAAGYAAECMRPARIGAKMQASIGNSRR